MSYINFSETQYVEVSRQGEQVIEGVKLYANLVGKSGAYINILYPPPLGPEVRIPLSVSQARTVGELLINFANQERCNYSKEHLELEFTIPRDQYPLNLPDYPNAVITSDEITAEVDSYGISLKQPIPEGARDCNEVHLSNQQLESLLRQRLKHSPQFQKVLKTILAETI